MSGDDFEEDTDFKLSSDRAREVSELIKSSLYQSVASLPKINFLVFGPGLGTAEFNTHRLSIKHMIRNKKRQNAEFPEDISPDLLRGIANPKDPGFIKRVLQNPATLELVMARGYDFIIIPLISVGTISEFSLFMTDAAIAPKIRLFLQKEHAKSKGFLATGPVSAFRKAYDHVRTFKDADDLLKKVCDEVDNLITMRLLQPR